MASKNRKRNRGGHNGTGGPSTPRTNAVSKPRTTEPRPASAQAVADLVKLIHEQRKSLDDMLSLVSSMSQGGPGILALGDRSTNSSASLAQLEAVKKEEDFDNSEDLQIDVSKHSKPHVDPKATKEELRKMNGIPWEAGSTLEGMAGVTRHRNALVNLRSVYKHFMFDLAQHTVTEVGDLPLGDGSLIKDIHVFPDIAPDTNVLQMNRVGQQEDSLKYEYNRFMALESAGTKSQPDKFAVTQTRILIPVYNDRNFTSVHDYMEKHGFDTTPNNAIYINLFHQM